MAYVFVVPPQDPMQFEYLNPTRIIFGAGCINKTGSYIDGIGKRALVVVDPTIAKVLAAPLATVLSELASKGIATEVFDRVQPNPIASDVHAGSKIAREFRADVIVGFGGGSSMDMARAIAVAATHEGSVMDYMYYCERQPTAATLPIVQIPTTSGTGSHVTCCAVITDRESGLKTALWHSSLFAKLALVDPELMLSCPAGITRSSGFDVFTHAFESYINRIPSVYTDLLGVEAIRIVIETLPRVLAEPTNLDLRIQMAWADTLAGVSIASSLTALPHAMGQAIGGHYPHVSHGQSLAAVYPAFLGYTWPASVTKFARVAGMLNPMLAGVAGDEAARRLEEEVTAFLEKIEMRYYLDDFGIKIENLGPVLRDCMASTDVEFNPIVPDAETVQALYHKCFRNSVTSSIR